MARSHAVLMLLALASVPVRADQVSDLREDLAAKQSELDSAQDEIAKLRSALVENTLEVKERVKDKERQQAFTIREENDKEKREIEEKQRGEHYLRNWAVANFDDTRHGRLPATRVGEHIKRLQKNNQGDLLTPSAVFFDRDDVIVGREAMRAAVMEPDASAECFKRDLGGAVYHRKVRGVDVPPEVLSAFVLDRLKRDAEQRLGPIRQLVIRVPAFFDETRRMATQEAGRLAGLEVLDIINEPTAAAVAFGYQHGFFRPAAADAAAQPMRVLVYDLGGGTFDVTILEIGPDGFRALATDGDVRLGGKDWDERLVDHLAGQFAAEHGVDPRSDPQDAVQLWLDAQEAKHALPEHSRATVMVFHAGIRMRIEVTRELFRDLTRDLLERTETTTSLVIKEAGLGWSQIDRVLLVGGSIRMPMVSEMLRQVTGKEPDRTASPDEAVAHGAALYAATLLDRGGHPGNGPLPAPLPKGTSVHLEYSYAANGRIAVSARVPQARQSARVDIVRNQDRDLEDLDTWRARLRGDAGQSGSVFASWGPVDLTDRTSVLRRLDALYSELGKTAAKEQLPPALARSQQTARAAAAELERTRTGLIQADQAKQAAGGRGEAMRLGTELARAKTAFEQSQTQSDFAYLVLGRDCIAARHTPSQMGPAVTEIQRLKPHVSAV